MGAKWFGASVLRKEDPAFLSGTGRFVDDIKLAGTLHAAFVRSPYGHAKITGIDAAAARALPGVHCVLTWQDLPEPLRSAELPLYVPHPAIRQCHMPVVLSRSEVCYAGEPLAVVIADSRYIAEDACALVDVSYDVLPAISDCLAATEPNAALAHEGAADNIAARVPIRVGDADAAFRNAAHVFGTRIFQHRGGPFFMETRGILVSHDARDCARCWRRVRPQGVVLS